MPRFLLLSKSFSNETVVSDKTSESNSPTAENEEKGDGFVASRQCAYQINDEKKLINIWIFGVLYNLNDYMKIITLFHSAKADYLIHMYIHSPGGSISIGCNILTAMSRCRAKIITHNIGLAASCGSLLLAFGDQIHVEDNSITMFHNALQGASDSVHRLLSQTQHTITMVTNLFEKMKARGIISEQEIEGIVKRGEEYFLTAPIMTERLKSAGIWYDGGK